jgi:hypothetical protein
MSDTALVPRRATMIGEQGFAPENSTQLMEMAKFIADSDLKPDWIKKPADAFLIMAVGMSWGFDAMMALQTLHVVKGKVGLPGETCAALIQSHPLCADYRWGFDGEGDARTAWVQTTRKGRPAANPRAEFSMADAKRARLTDGDNWKKYPDDMLLWKAVAREKRRNWPDIYPGLRVAEDIVEIEGERDVTPTKHAPVPDPLLEGAFDVAPVPTVGNEGSQSREAGEPEPGGVPGPASDSDLPGGVEAPERSAETVPAEDAPPVLPAAPAPVAEITEAWDKKDCCVYCHRFKRWADEEGHGVEDNGEPCRFKK